jgi:hypothetical protein
MPGKIKSAKQFRFLRAAASGKLRGMGPSPDVAEEMLSHEKHSVKSKFAKALRKRRKR